LDAPLLTSPLHARKKDSRAILSFLDIPSPAEKDDATADMKRSPHQGDAKGHKASIHAFLMCLMRHNVRSLDRLKPPLSTNLAQTTTNDHPIL
jgi:hypothetical protein